MCAGGRTVSFWVITRQKWLAHFRWSDIKLINIAIACKLHINTSQTVLVHYSFSIFVRVCVCVLFLFSRLLLPHYQIQLVHIGLPLHISFGITCHQVVYAFVCLFVYTRWALQLHWMNDTIAFNSKHKHIVGCCCSVNWPPFYGRYNWK